MGGGSTWTTERVLALAPDPASARAGQGLTSPHLWSNLGMSENLLWGECRGSGSKPYQTKVAPEDPAFACSCPSRKFPCKHALGLLLIWAGSASPVAATELPPWVVTWVESRAQKAATKRDEQPEAAPADSAARAKREAARLSKVAAGLDDLDLWLGDLVRSGLASLGTRPKNLWDEQARRLVDAQCPGVASRLRQIDAMSFAGEGWQTALLDRLAQLHLLIQGFRHRDHLPPAVLDDLKTAIGFPANMDAIRTGTAGPHVRDTWQVLGQAFALEDKITVRRTWLAGRNSRRSALILDFAALNRPFEVQFLPGTAVDATLGFFPGAAPLRTLVVDRHSAPEPFDSLAGGTTIAAAQASFAEVLARSPWVDLIPVVLADVTMTIDDSGWSAVDREGSRVPFARKFEGGWQLEAESGGQPMTLAGEFDGSILNPLGAMIAEKFISPVTSDLKVVADPTVGTPGRWLTPGSTLLTEVTAAAVVGVDRKPPPNLPLDHPVGSTLAQIHPRPSAARLLAIAAAGGLYARAGHHPRTVSTPPVPPALHTEDRPECSPAAACRLRKLLDDESTRLMNLGSGLTFEWFKCCDQAGQRLPAGFLVDVLDECRHHPGAAPSVLAILGNRGRWLAGRNPAWRLHAEKPADADDAVLWETGTRSERLAALRSLRATDPARARRLVESTFATEPATSRAEIVESFDRNLGMADEPFLEAALDDRSREVRAAAALRLSAMTGSKLAARMAERARAMLWWDGDSLIIEPPRDRDPAMIRDGIADRPKTGPGGSGVPDPTGPLAWSLREIMTRTPLDAIARHLAQPPADIIDAALGSEWGKVLQDAWEAAAVRQRNAAWCRALARIRLARGTSADCPEFVHLFGAFAPEARNALIAEQLGACSHPISASDSVVFLLMASSGILEIDAGRTLLQRLLALLVAEQEAARADPRVYYQASNRTFSTLLQGLDRKLPFDLIDETATAFARDLVVQPSLDSPFAFSLCAAFAAMLDRWKFRRDMHQEFAVR